MENSFLTNQIIHDNTDNKDYRVLWISPDQNLPSYWICLSDNSNIPTVFQQKDVEAGLASHRYSFAPDMWLPASAYAKPCDTALRKRDRAWNLIQDSVRKEPEIYDRNMRATMLKEISEKSGVKHNNIYNYLGKYWKYGKVPDALIPDYSVCGKVRDNYKESSKRPGRPKAEGAEGKKLTVKDLQHFQSAVAKYYNGGDKLSFEQTYKKLLKDYYSIKDVDGNVISLMEPDELPSRNQFRYWYKKNGDVLEEALGRDGERNYPLMHRGSTKTTQDQIYGPGIACQIDATMADIYLVSQDDRTAILGRPTMYFTIDSYSRIVTGMNISLDPPSWNNAARTILNSVENKPEFCKKYGVEITEEQWPCMQFPTVILGDRGEMESATADVLVNSLGITIENAPPYRGDLKGIIEKHFDLINIDMASLPGKVKKDFGKRLAPDYRLEATLDINQFTAIIIQCVLEYNNYHYMKSYRKTTKMRQHKVKPIPLEIWNFGIRHLSGGLKAMNREFVRYQLLPKGEASVTRQGILFSGRYYTCDQAEQNRWYDKAKTTSSWKVSIAYDPCDAALIYLCPISGEPPIECRLLEKDYVFNGKSAEEANRMAELDQKEQAAYEPTEDFHRIQLDEYIEKVKKEAKAMQPDEIEKSKATRIAEIKENRRKEKELIKEKNTQQTLDEINYVPPNPPKEPEEAMSPLTRKIRDALYAQLEKEGHPV